MERLASMMKQGSFLFILLLLVTWMVGCSEDRAHLAPPPDLETVDFGDVYLGTSLTRQVYWKNRGVRPTRFTGHLSVDPIGQGFDFSPTGDKVVQPGAETPEVPIAFAPFEERTSRAEASPIVQAGKVYVDSIRLLGNGVAQRSDGALSLADGDLVPTRALDFGNVLVGASLTRGFNISNSSDIVITVINNQWFYRRFFRVTTPATDLFEVPPKDSVPVIITFSPPWVDRFADAAIFEDGTGNNFAGTAVKGKGVAQISRGNLFLKDNEDIDAGIPLDFGRVMIGDNGQRAFSIKNRGSTEITVNVTWAKGDQGFGPLPPVRIPAQNSIPVTITFTPPDVDTFTDAVTFSDASGNNNLAATFVTGEGVTYILRGGLRLEETILQPLEILDFGKVQVNGTATRTIYLSNRSYPPSTVTITSAGLRAGDQYFSSNVSPPVTLGPGASLPVTITFNPLRIGPFEDAITFSDASGWHMVGVVIRGQGVVKEE